jgi:hypothetical protein
MKNIRIRYTKGNYQKAIEFALRAGELNPLAGKVTHLDIYHDDNCAIFTGGSCNCNPDIIQRAEKPAADIGLKL